MSRALLLHLVLPLSVLALAACGENATPTQPETGAELASAASLAPNTWTLKAAPPNYLFVNGLSAGVVPDASGQSIVYLLGGRDDDGGCGANIATYKIGTNTWTVKGFEPRVYVFNSNGVGKIGNTLYISGGESYCGGSWHIDGSFSAYDPATNTLTNKPTPPKLTADGSPASLTASSTFFPEAAPTTSTPTRTIVTTNPSDGSSGTIRPPTSGPPRSWRRTSIPSAPAG